MSDLLAPLLRRRLEIIADHEWRDRDPAGHLDALREISDRISHWSFTHGDRIDARLRHYLTQCSYDKALAHIETSHRAGE